MVRQPRQHVTRTETRRWVISLTKSIVAWSFRFSVDRHGTGRIVIDQCIPLALSGFEGEKEAFSAFAVPISCEFVSAVLLRSVVGVDIFIYIYLGGGNLSRCFVGVHGGDSIRVPACTVCCRQY